MRRSLDQSFTKETAAVHAAVKNKNCPFYFPFGAQSSIVMVESSWGLERRQAQEVPWVTVTERSVRK